MKCIAVVLGVGLLLAPVTQAAPRRPSPKVDQTVYVKPPVDKRTTTNKSPLSKPVYDKTAFVSPLPDPNKKTTFKTRPTQFEKVGKHNRKRSHFSEWP